MCVSSLALLFFAGRSPSLSLSPCAAYFGKYSTICCAVRFAYICSVRLFCPYLYRAKLNKSVALCLRMSCFPYHLLRWLLQWKLCKNLYYTRCMCTPPIHTREIIFIEPLWCVCMRIHGMSGAWGGGGRRAESARIHTHAHIRDGRGVISAKLIKMKSNRRECGSLAQLNTT